jgi:hypothetical protein
MQSLHGIASSVDGRYVMVSLHKRKSGHYRCAVRKWPRHSKLRALLLLNRQVYCGVAASWQPATALPLGHGLAAGSPESPLRPIVDIVEAAIHTEALGDNLAKLLPDDAFLCSVPLFLGNPSVHSFLSVYLASGYCVIGVVIKKELSAVFTMAPAAPDALESHLGRIKRYWKHTRPHEPFPTQIYVFGNDGMFKSEEFSVHPLPVVLGNKTLIAEEELRALGCALAADTGGIAPFAVAQSDAVVRMVRSVGYCGAAALVAVAAILTLAPAVMTGFTGWKVRSSEASYRAAIINNPEIKSINAKNDSLAKGILKLRAKSARQTQWARFLQALGESRPDGLFFDKLGSEPVAGSASEVRIALSGIAKSETLVTDLIARLQKNGLSNVSLSFLEKNEKNPTLCNFRIICIMTITGA